MYKLSGLDTLYKRYQPLFRILGALVVAGVFVLLLLSDTRRVGADSSYTQQVATTCDRLEHLQSHIHVHLSVYVDGQAVRVPQGIGLGYQQGRHCYYWLHTHNDSGIIHIEAPSNHTFVLGNFLAIWTERFASSGYPAQLKQSGWQAYVNGVLYNGDWHNVPLTRHALVTLVYHSPTIRPDSVYSWPPYF